MSTRFFFAFLLACGIATLVVLSGCSQTAQEPKDEDSQTRAEGNDDYNPHDVPITDEQKAQLREESAEFADAVALIKQYRNALERETADGIPENPYKAHQSLDKADLVLQWLPKIARDSNVAKEHWERVNTTANDLRTLFEQVHQRIDDQQTPDFAAVASDIDQELADLEAVAATTGSGSNSEN